MRQRWVYGKGASSAFGSAWSLSGAAGSFSRSKSYTSTIDGSVTFPVVRGKAGYLFRSNFKMGKYDLQEYDYVTARWYYVGTSVRKTSWERGIGWTPLSTVPASVPRFCQPYLSGSGDQTTVSKAVTWTDGISLSQAMQGILIGVTLSSRTGFTTTATNHVHFNRRGRLCGRYGPLSHPGALIARKPR